MTDKNIRQIPKNTPSIFYLSTNTHKRLACQPQSMCVCETGEVLAKEGKNLETIEIEENDILKKWWIQSSE